MSGVCRGGHGVLGEVMAGIWAQVALVFGLALAAGVIAHRYRLSTALVEIIVGMAAGSILSAAGSYSPFAVQEPWVKAFAGIGAMFLTSLQARNSTLTFSG